MNVQIYLIIGLSLILSMFFLDKKSLKRFVRKDFWTQIDEISNNDLMQRLMIFSDESDNSSWKIKIRKSIKEVVGKSGIPMLSFIRFQTISIISSISAFVIQIFLFFGSIFNLIIHRKRLEILAENMGPKVLEMPSFNILFALAIGILFYFLPLLLFALRRFRLRRKRRLAHRHMRFLRILPVPLWARAQTAPPGAGAPRSRRPGRGFRLAGCLQECPLHPGVCLKLLVCRLCQREIRRLFFPQCFLLCMQVFIIRDQIFQRVPAIGAFAGVPLHGTLQTGPH